MSAKGLYAEVTGTIDCSLYSKIVFTHQLTYRGAALTPDEVGIECTTDLVRDQPAFLLLTKSSTQVIWRVSGTSESISYRAWARKGHSIIDTVISASAAPDGDSGPAVGARSEQIHLDFGLTPESFSD